MLIQFIVSALVVVLAGVLLTRCADRIADLTGLGGVLVGSIFLAAATSLPELMVDISAVRQGMPNLAVGDLFGSSLFNLLILAIADIVHKERAKVFSHAARTHALSATLSIVMTALAGVGILLAPTLHHFAIGGVSYGSFAIVGAYLLGLRMVFRDQRSQSTHHHPEAPNALKVRWNHQLAKPLIGYLLAGLFITVAAPYLAEAAGEIADQTGLGGTFIGTTLVALCTSLPELVSCIAAVRMGAMDLAIGNIFGSNAFNMVMLLPLDFVAEGPLLAQVSPIHVITSFATIVITSVALMGQLYQVEKRKTLIEPDAFLVLILVLMSLGGVYLLT